MLNFDFDDPEDGQLNVHSTQLVIKSKKPWLNSVDMINFSPSTLYALVGYDEEVGGGRVFGVDLMKEVTLPIFQSHKGLSALDSHGLLLAVSTGGIIDGTTGTGEFYIVDSRITKSPQSIRTGQMDMDAVRFSPCGGYIACSETSDNSVSVYDLRQIDRPLLRPSHTTPNGADSMMGLQWFHEGMRLATGGMDGIVKIHDLASGRVTQEISIGHHINCIASSFDDATLFVGTDFGTIHCFSQNPSIASYYSLHHRTFY